MKESNVAVPIVRFGWSLILWCYLNKKISIFSPKNWRCKIIGAKGSAENVDEE